jgi:hypothetical protein
MDQGAGRAWVQEKVEGLADNRAIVRAALTPLGEAAITQSNGAIYMVCTGNIQGTSREHSGNIQ